MAKNVTTDQTRLLFITTARGNADAALPRGRRSVRRAIRLVHEEGKEHLHVPDRSNRRITLRYRRKNWEALLYFAKQRVVGGSLESFYARVSVRGLRLTPCFRACTGAWGPDLAH